ncbi:MAG TPA: N-acetylneuraminate synthase family protein [Myxococcota bacterium]|jgi:N-acetylneuraminate synthase
MARTIEIAGPNGNVTVGDGYAPYVIAEVAQAHDGSLGMAHAFIDGAARAGANAIKFQTHIASAESTPSEQWRVKFSQQDATRSEYWKRMEFTEPQWLGLKSHADEKKIAFLSSPFSMEAAALLERVGVPAWKVGSGEVTNTPFLTRIASTKKPVLLSSGMSTWAELDVAVAAIEREGAPLALFQCTTSYPCPASKTGLNVIGEMRARYPRAPVGLSDHSATTHAGIAAVALGAQLLEVHICFSKEQFGPDTRASLTIDELAHLVDGARFVHEALAQPVDKDATAQGMSELKRIFGKSVVAARDLAAGTLLDEAMLALKKPGTGIAAARLSDVVGRRLAKSVVRDELLASEHIEGGLS